MKLSKRLSYLLRHGAREAGVAIDAEGWVAIADALAFVRVDRGVLDRIVATNEKARFEIAGDRIRAVQGHSSGATRDAIEATWERYDAADNVFHGTSIEAVSGIAREGIRPQTRTHVHMADGLESAVGKRANVDVMLEVSAQRLRERGLTLWRSPNGVILAREVPPDAIVGLVPMTGRARAVADALRASLAIGSPLT